MKSIDDILGAEQTHPAYGHVAAQLLEICDEAIGSLVEYQERCREEGRQQEISPHLVEKLAVRVAAMRAKPKPAIAELRWRPGPAQGDTTEVYCGDDFICAVAVSSGDRSKQWWEYAVVRITEDGCEVDGSPWGWSWQDVDWYVPASELSPGPIPGVKRTEAEP